MHIPTLPVAELELPEEFDRLRDLAYNLWWCWTPKATRLFRRIDAEHWAHYNNPVELLIGLGAQRWEVLRADDEFRQLANEVVRELDEYSARPRWFTQRSGDLGGPVAYFSMEFGLHESISVYSGGLGILAGDHCKAASDLGVPLVGVSLLYRSGYFKQTVDADGYQQHFYPSYDFARLPIRRVEAPDGGHLTIPVDLPGRVVQAAVWKVQVGLVPVLLLDTDTPLNDAGDRPITSILYVRGREMRLCQEVVLGVGGVRALRALGIRPGVWHMNEGHVAFLGLERARELVAAGEGLEDALKASARNTVFTTHTPVPAGNESFDKSLVRRYVEPWTAAVGSDAEEALRLGTEDDLFNLTVMAIRLSSSANGVSRLHGETASAMWRHLWPGAPEHPIGAVTNGVHTSSWVGPEMRKLYATHLGSDWEDHLVDPEFWQRIRDVPDSELWTARRRQKERLIRFVRERLLVQGARHGMAPDELRRVESLLDPNALTIGFARRFATYKRAMMVLSDLERLQKLLTDKARPVQLLFAGKAHPADRAGQDVIRYLFELTQGDLHGRVVFVENYDMELGRILVQGCDVWLNTPRRPQEASGTSGQKSPVNGGLNLSISDGWWAEGATGDNGWTIGEESYGSVEEQDERDAAALYELLEDEVVPTYFERASEGIPERWLQMMKSSIASVVPRFSAHRMVRDYVEQVYLPAAERR
jgi:starch phosphorylase